MGIGLCGAHRSGKTTLAKAFADRIGINYVTLSTTEVLASMGWDCRDISRIEDRIEIQKRMTARAGEVFTKASRYDFISDRTPLDVAAYMLADANGSVHLSDAQHKDIEGILEDCVAVTRQAFRGVVLIPPVLPYIYEPGKPAPNVSYQWHFHYLVLGLALHPGVGREIRLMPAKIIDLDERLEVLENVRDDLFEDDVSAADGWLNH